MVWSNGQKIVKRGFKNFLKTKRITAYQNKRGRKDVIPVK